MEKPETIQTASEAQKLCHEHLMQKDVSDILLRIEEAAKSGKLSIRVEVSEFETNGHFWALISRGFILKRKRGSTEFIVRWGDLPEIEEVS